MCDVGDLGSISRFALRDYEFPALPQMLRAGIAGNRGATAIAPNDEFASTPPPCSKWPSA